MNRNSLYRYRNWPCRYTDYSMPFAVNRSLSVSMQSPTHIECSSVFPFQETGTNTFSSSQARFQQFFPRSVSLARAAFSLVNLRSVFRLIASGVNTDASTWLLPSDLFRTYSQTWDRVANLSQSKRVFSAALCPTCKESSQAYLRLPQSRLQTSMKCTYERHTWPFSNGTPPSQLRTS